MSREEFRECPGLGTATGPGTPPLAARASGTRMPPTEETVQVLLAVLLLLLVLLVLLTLFDGRDSDVEVGGGS